MTAVGRAGAQAPSGEVEVETVVPEVFEGDLRDLPPPPPQEPAEVPRADVAVEPPVAPPPTAPTVLDPLPRSLAPAAPLMLPGPLVNVEGMIYTGSIPPDPVGDVGPNHYVQMVNRHFAVYDKQGNEIKGATLISQLWANQNTQLVCRDHGRGDPIVLYDPLADRWLLSQFAFPSDVNGPWRECVAISRGPDPVTDGWHLYEFVVPTPQDALPDYPKLAVWPDAYYLATNDVDLGQNPPVVRGVGVYALERDKMLAGQTARIIFSPTFRVPPLPGIPGNILLPSDLDGCTPPPPGSPNYYYRQVDGDVSGGIDRLEIYEFHVDWDVPANSTFTGPLNIPLNNFDANMCNFFNWCIPQNGTTQLLDPISKWPMWRLQYRNFVTHQTLVGNFTIDVNTDNAGIRWFELRSTGGGGWTVFQNGNWADDNPDDTAFLHRWMGSAAMDRAHDIALGYSTSSGQTHPSIAYTARLGTDPLNTMPNGEQIVQPPGQFSQIGSNPNTSDDRGHRWGDYSSMNVDPADDCTFWYTQQYIRNDEVRHYPPPPPNGTVTGDWGTRIVAFRLPECKPPDHYVCYSILDRTRQVDPTVPPLPDEVQIKDQFDEQVNAYRPGNPWRFCVPASKNDSEISDLDTHLKAYRISRLTGRHREPFVDVRDQFGFYTLHLKKEMHLLVPTTKTLFELGQDPPLPDPDPQAQGYEHYKCWRVDVRQTLPRPRLAELEDQFGRQKADLRKPKSFCAPATKNGEPVKDPTRTLTCYGFRGLVKRDTPIASVLTKNQFGKELLQVRRDKELCVPSWKLAERFP